MSIISTGFNLLVLVLIDYIIFRWLVKPIYNEYKQADYLIKTGVFTHGTVVGVSTKKDLDGRAQYAPVVEFEDEGGRSHEIVSKDYKFTKPHIQTTVQVCYSSANPIQAIIAPRSYLQFKILLLFFISFVAVGINFGIIYKLVDSYSTI